MKEAGKSVSSIARVLNLPRPTGDTLINGTQATIGVYNASQSGDTLGMATSLVGAGLSGLSLRGDLSGSSGASVRRIGSGLADAAERAAPRKMKADDILPILPESQGTWYDTRFACFLAEDQVVVGRRDQSLALPPTEVNRDDPYWSGLVSQVAFGMAAAGVWYISRLGNNEEEEHEFTDEAFREMGSDDD